ncbi:MAG: phage portal protein [Rickettsiaceae bacterium]|nr:phage portal protein [Rickettsiaceae bacterium]
MINKYLNKLFPAQRLDKKSSSQFYLPHDLFKQESITPNEYSNNVIVYRCVNIISQGASHIPWVIYEKNSSKVNKLKNHHIYDLLRRPNNIQSGAEFFASIVASKLLYGNAYIACSGDKYISSLILLHPSKVELKFENGIPSYYSYRASGKETKFPLSNKSRKSQILHIKSYNPNSSYTGIPALKAAAKSIELHNATSEWNSSLLRNGARPTGALIMKDSGQYLSDEQFTRLQEQLYDKFSGSSNAGKPLLLEGGLDWRDMSIHPKDMDYIESKNAAAREIALAFGLPPQLLGISGDNTYSNMQEARLALWEETIIPILDNLADSMSSWFSGLFGQELIVDFDRNSISALSEKRQATWDKIARADFMTINEKREQVGLSPIKGGEGFII